MATNQSRPPGENFIVLHRILKGGSLSDIPISTIEPLYDENGRLRQPMTREEFDQRYKEVSR